MPFRADTEPATRAIATLARAVATGMGSVSASALAAHQSTGAALGGIGASALKAAASLTAMHYVAIGAFAAFTAAAAAGAAELERFQQIAKRAADANVGTTFFQSFSAGAHKFRLDVKDLEADLTRLERATRDRFDAERPGDVANRARDLLAERFLGTADFGTSEATRLFDAATSAEERVRAVLVGLRDMEEAGNRLAAIDLARQLGLTALAEQVDRGTASFAGFLAEVDRAAATGLKDGSLVSPELIARAEELKARWEANTRELRQNLRPILDECARLALDIGHGAAWTAEQFTKVVGVVGRVVGLMRELASLVPGTIQGAVAATDERTITALQTRLRDAGLTPQQRRGLEQQLQEVEARRAQREASLVPEMPILDMPSASGAGGGPRAVSFSAPVPRARPAGAPSAREVSSGGGSSAEETDKRTEAVEKFIRAQERAIALSQAELATVGSSAVERARLTEVIKAEAQAREQGGRLTEAERDRIAALAEAQQRLKNAIEEATAAQKALSDALQYGGDRLIDLVFRGGKASDMLRGLAAELARAALTGQGVFARLLGLAPPAGSPAGSMGGLLGLLGGLFGAGGGGGGGGLLSAFSLFHAGGVIGAGGVPVIAPASLLAGAPRAHSGRRLGADEVPIIAQLGEEVLTRNQRRAAAQALALGDRAAAQASRSSGPSVTIGDIRVDAPGASRDDAEEIARRIDQRIREVTVPFLRAENARGVEVDPYTRGMT